MKKYAYAIGPIVLAVIFVVVLFFTTSHTNPNAHELKTVKKWLRETSNNPKALEVLDIAKIKESELPSLVARMSSDTTAILNSFYVYLRYENTYGAIRSRDFYVLYIMISPAPIPPGYIVCDSTGKVFTDY